MSRWQVWVLAGVGLVLLVLLYGPDDEDSVIPPPVADPAEEPDLTMEEAIITQFNPDGTLQYRLVAARIRHFERDDSTQIDAPSLEMHRAPQPPWWLSAASGEVRHRATVGDKSEEVVFLRDSVSLEQREASRFAKLTTDALYVYPERRFAETALAVMIDTNAGRTKGVGLSGDLDRGLFKLSSDATQRVHTIVLPSQFQRADDRPAS